MVKENSYGLIRAHTTEISFRTTFTGKVNINGQTVVFTMDNGLTIKWRAKALSLGVTDASTKDSGKTTACTARASTRGRTVAATMAIGRRENNMVSAS